MSYKVYIDHDGGSAPRITCDSWGEPITDPAMALTGFNGSLRGMIDGRDDVWSRNCLNDGV
jgi:hypothetical protein